MALRLRRGTEAERITITPQAGELIYVLDTKKVYVGDGLTPGGNPIDTNVGALSIDDLTDVNTSGAVSPADGEALVWDAGAGEWQPKPVLTLETDPTVSGDLKVNIVAQDSTLLVDTFSGLIRGEILTNNVGLNGLNPTITSTGLNFSFTTLDVSDDYIISVESPNRSKFQLTKKDDFVDLSGVTNPYGSVDFAREDINGGLVTSRVSGGKDFIFLAADPGGDLLANADYVMFWERKFGIGTRRPEKTLDVRGDAVIHGGLAADLIGSVFFDDSARVLDATDGTLHIANVNVVGQTGNVPATPGTVDSWLEVTVNGAIKYLPLYS